MRKGAEKLSEKKFQKNIFETVKICLTQNACKQRLTMKLFFGPGKNFNNEKAHAYIIIHTTMKFFFGPRKNCNRFRIENK